MSQINTTRCSPVQMRKALEMVEALKQSGMEFVPVPVLNDADREKLLLITASRLEQIATAAEGSGT
jgi:hypothetical protein